MAEMPEETRQKISTAVKRAWQSPATRKRLQNGIKQAWASEARRAAMSKERREFWQKRREAKAGVRPPAQADRSGLETGNDLLDSRVV